MTNGVMRRGATWSYTLYTPNLDADGKPLGGKGRTTWVGGFATKEAAQIAKREAQNSKDKGEAVEPIRQSLREYVEQSWLPAVAANVKPTSASSYRQSIAHALTVIGDKKIQRLTPTDVQGMVTKLLADGRTPRTVGKTLTVLRIAMKHAVTLRVIPRDPTTGIQKPLVETVRRRTMTMAEVAAIDAASRDTTWSAFVRLALYTGCRRGENLALTWKDCELDGDNPTITIRRNVVDVDGKRIEQTPKNGKEREVTIDTETVSILRAHKASQNAARLRLGSDWNALDLVTCLADGSPPMPHSATQAWSRLCKTAKIEHHNLHNARHTHATTLLEADVPLHVVADRLGHLDAMVTATIYAHVTTARRASTAEVFAAAVDTATAAR
jgi:integrase